MIPKLVPRGLGQLGAILLLSGCNPFNFFGQSQPPKPPSFSYYSMVNFSNPQEPAFCQNEPKPDPTCFYEVNANFGKPLANAGWTENNAMTDGQYNGSWTTAIQSSQIIGDTSNLVYFGSHGSIETGNAYMCLRNCNGINLGGTNSVSTVIIPNAWNGPNWFIVDGCDVVQPDEGWEGVFGGSLHGIMGWNGDVSAFGPSSGPAFLTAFVNAVTNGSPAYDSWLAAILATGEANLGTMLLPLANRSDVIEASGGPNFGPNGSTNPVYFSWNGTPLQPQIQLLNSAPQDSYSLVAEQMDEASWISQYGGGNVQHQYTKTSTVHTWISAGAILEHYPNSGGLGVMLGTTGTSQGFDMTSALQYPTQWIGNNGGLPSDAALTYQGTLTDTPHQYKSFQGAPYPNNLEYMFTWRHGTSSLLGADKITILVDDAGSLTLYSNYYFYPPCQCYKENQWYAPPWVPQYNVDKYVRIWRKLGQSQAPPRKTGHHRAYNNLAGYAYCAPDMASSSTIANPCSVTQNAASNTYMDLSSQMTVNTSEPFQ